MKILTLRGMFALTAILFAALVILLALTFSPDDVHVISARSGGEYLSKSGRGMLEAVNKQRREAGIPELTWSDQAEMVAKSKTKEMSDNKYFSHESPINGNLENQFKEFGGIKLGENAVLIGENIAKTINYPKENLASEFLNELFMESEPHKTNILNTDFSQMGAAVYYANDGNAYTAQEFLQP